MSSSSGNSGGVGFCGLLALMLIGFQLAGIINVSWWLVLLPLWGPVLVALLMLVLSVCIMVFSSRK